MTDQIIPHLVRDRSQPVFFMTDLIVVPIFMYIVISLFKNFVKKKEAEPIYKKYFMNALYVRLVCAFLTACMYDFYYDGGDSIVYYLNILYLKPLLFENPPLFFHVLSHPQDFESQKWLCTQVGDCGLFLFDGTTKIVILIGLFLSYFCLSSFMVISMTITIFAFLGCWRLFKMFHEMYPQLEKEMALACLFIPSVCFWGTGLMKDSLCVGALGIFSYAVYEGLIRGKEILKNIVLIIFMAYMLKEIKEYIILSYAPAVGVWLFSRYRYNIKSQFFKVFIGPFLMLIGLGVGLLILSQMGKVAERYNFEEMTRTAKDTQNWMVYNTERQGGSFYTLGDIEYSTAGMIKLFPKAVNVALFRPYIWEARKPLLVPAALEGIVSLFLTIQLLLRAGLFRVLKMIAANPEIQFCLSFAVIFAFAVGFTSYNFGALARYKIPFMPFYYIALFILADSQKKQKDQLVKTQ